MHTQKGHVWRILLHMRVSYLCAALRILGSCHEAISNTVYTTYLKPHSVEQQKLVYKTTNPRLPM